MERIYFSKQNFEVVFKVVNRKVNEEVDYQILSDDNFKQELIKIMKTVYQSRNKFKISPNTNSVDISRYLSQKVINISTSYFINSIKNSKKNSDTSLINREIDSNINKNINYVSPRPENQFKNNNTNQKYEEILNQRNLNSAKMPEQINFSENPKIDLGNDDIKKKYDTLFQERQSQYENMPNTLSEQFNNGNNYQLSQQVNNDIKKMNNPTNKSPINEFTSSPQINPNIELIINDAKSNEIKNFKDVSSMSDKVSNNPDNILDMVPDQIDYEELNTQIGNPIEDNEVLSNLNISEDQFLDQENKNIDEIVPSSMVENSNNISLEEMKNINNVQLNEITSIIKTQQDNIESNNNKLEAILNLLNNRNLDKYYQTIIDLPNFIKGQMLEKFSNRSYSLVVSSRDRDLKNSSFNKYNFKITFGGNGNNTVVSTHFDKNTKSSGPTGSDVILKNSTSKIYSSNLSFNPSVINILRNIVMFKLNRVIIPRPRDSIYFPEPYYFVAIDEFESNIMTSKNLSERIFCKVHFDKEVVFGGIGNSAVNNDESTGTTSISSRAKDDNGRKFLYYKNDDGNCCKKFYNSPLARLDNLTIKLLDSSGRVLSDTWSDVDYKDDCTRTSSGSDYIYNVSDSFLNNSFLKDEIHVLGNYKNTDGSLSSPNNIGESRITQIDMTNKNIYLKTDLGENSGDNALINLTNQIEYIFEVETKEHDLEAKINADLI